MASIAESLSPRKNSVDMADSSTGVTNPEPLAKKGSEDEIASQEVCDKLTKLLL